jgi:hypothetical protein
MFWSAHSGIIAAFAIAAVIVAAIQIAADPLRAESWRLPGLSARLVGMTRGRLLLLGLALAWPGAADHALQYRQLLRI